jgi:hypothetical protein
MGVEDLYFLNMFFIDAYYITGSFQFCNDFNGLILINSFIARIHDNLIDKDLFASSIIKRFDDFFYYTYARDHIGMLSGCDCCL